MRATPKNFDAVLEHLQVEMDAIGALIRALRARAPRQEDIEADLSPVLFADTQRTTGLQVDKNEFSGLRIWEAAERLLKRSGRAMTLAEMVEQMKQGGLEQGGISLPTRIGTVLKGLPQRFEKKGPALWNLRRDR